MRSGSWGADEEQVEGTEEVEEMAGGQSVAGGAERRHEGGGYGNAGNDVSFASCAEGNDACSTATEGNEHVVKCG